MTSAPASFGADFEVTGFTVAAIGSIPINEMFDLHARVGVLFSDTEITLSGGSGTLSLSETVSASAQDLFYGVGAALHLGGNWSLNLDYQLYKDIGDEEKTGETDVDSITLAAIFRF